MKIERRVGQFALVTLALSTITGACVPDDDCAMTATCPPENDGATSERADAVDRQPDTSMGSDGGAHSDASVDVGRGADDAPFGADQSAPGDGALFGDAPPDESTPLGDALPGDSALPSDGTPRTDAPSSIPCAAGTKRCGEQCVAVDDPTYGCGATSCDKSSCPVAGTGTLACQGGACVIATCGAGTKKCAGKCVALDDPTYGCGTTTCDATTCPVPGSGTLTCAAGACVIGSCGTGTKKCGTKCVPTDRNNGCSDLANCSPCAASETCVGSPTKCACVPNNDACAGKNCGSVVNNCGQMVSCGNCTAPQTCNGGGTSGMCGCTKKTCTGLCGPQPDGCGGTLQCPACCVPKTTCSATDCGMVSNNCGGMLSCKAPKTCAASDCGKTIDTGCGTTVNCPACPCTDNGTACSGKVCGTAVNNCGATVTCQPNACTALPETIVSCKSNQCVLDCPQGATPLSCSTASAPACGRWTFEAPNGVATAEGWFASDPGGNRGGAHNNIWDTSAPFISNGALGMKFTSSNGWIVPSVKLCPQEQQLSLAGKTISARVRVELNAGSPPSNLSAALYGVETAFDPMRSVVIAYTAQDFAAGTWITLTGMAPDLLSLSQISIELQVWSSTSGGTVFIDDVNVQ